MTMSDIEKVLKALSPFSREEARERYDAFLRGELSAEEEELMQEHFLLDEEALLEFADSVAQKIDAGKIPLREWPSDLPMPSLEQFASEEEERAIATASFGSSYSFSDAARRTLGVIWEEVKAQGQAWATEQRETLQRCLEGAMARWGIRARAVADLAKAEPVLVMGGNLGNTAARVVDENWQPQGTIVLFEVTDGPRITADGHFTYTLHTQEQRWQGRRTMCTVPLDSGQRLSFSSTVERDQSGQGCIVRFSAEGLPQKALNTGEVTIPLKEIHLWILPPAVEAV